MIYYNFRHNGPYEYDKFILNYFQFCNEVKELNVLLKNSDFNGLLDTKNKIDQIWLDTTNEKKGFNNNLLKIKLRMR